MDTSHHTHTMSTPVETPCAQVRTIVEAFKVALAPIYGTRLKQVILYGSWARGEATEHSDIDVVIVLEGAIKPGREIDTMIDVITDMNLDHGVLLSVYPISEDAYAHVQSPLLMNVRREGVPM